MLDFNNCMVFSTVNWRLSTLRPIWCWLGSGNELTGWRSEWERLLRGSYLFLKTQPKLACWNGSMQHSMECTIHQQLCRKMTFQKIKQIYIQGKELFLQNLRNGWRDQGLSMENEFCFKLKKKIWIFLADFCWREWFKVVDSDFLIVVFVYINGRVYVCMCKWYILKFTLDNKKNILTWIYKFTSWPSVHGRVTVLWAGEGVGSV